MKIIIVLIFAAISALTPEASADVTFDLLHTTQRDFTNATIIRTNPAYVVVDWPGGLAKVWMTNLSPELQKQFGYSASNAAAAVLLEQRNAAAKKQSDIAYRKYLGSLRGTNQVIRVVSILDAGLGECSIAGQTAHGTVYLMSMPASASGFFTRKADLQNQIADLKETPITVTATVNDPNDPDPGFTSQLRAREALDDAKQARQQQLGDLNSQLKDLNDSQLDATTLMAYPTGLSRDGIPIWQCD